jgi:ankyrin repeat protein
MDDLFLTESLFRDENLSDELYQLVLHGHIAQLKSRLRELPNPIEHLVALSSYDEEQLTLLMVAALHGHDETVRFLLTCDPSDEQVKLRGDILDGDQRRMHGVNALYCACYRGHFQVAKTLIELGKTDVNEDSSDYPWYPLLLHATINNRLDIVRFLVENRYVDVNETKSDGYPNIAALMFAVRNGHTGLVQYLIDAGVDVNYVSPYLYAGPRTALLIAVSNEQLELFVLLHQHGATIDHSVLERAVKHKSYSILGFLLDKSLITPDQLEVEAASCLSVSSQIAALHRTVKLLRISLEYRQRTGQRKFRPPPLSIYDYQQECQTVDELERITNDRDRIFIEFLLIQDRLRSHDHQSKMTQLFEEYSLMLVAKKRFDLCFDVCHRSFDLAEQSDQYPSLHLFIWLICEMFSADHCLPVDRFLQAADLLFKPFDQKYSEQSLNNALFMVILATKVTFSHPSKALSTNASVLDASTQGNNRRRSTSDLQMGAEPVSTQFENVHWRNAAASVRQ